ncbi:MAG: hypothetical protein Q9170_000903 [Blastenia crenularia]
MAMADASRQSDALPSISYIDLEKIKRESFYSTRIPSTAATMMPAPPLASPSSMYSGPPPPYSYPSSTAGSIVGGHTNGNGYISPSTEPRNPVQDEKDQQQAIRLSLPSIHELHRDQPLSITSLLSRSSPSPPTLHQTHHSSNPSPRSPVGRTHKDDPCTGSSTTPARTRSSPIHSEDLLRTHPSPRPTFDTASNRLPSSHTRESHYPPMLPPRTIPSPAGVINRPSLPSSIVQHSSPTYDPVPRPSPLMNLPQTYASYPTSYSYAPPMSAVTSNYQSPSPSNHSIWRYPEPEVDRTEDYRRHPMKESGVKPTFGEAVKRHLDNFDLETSLNEVGGGSLD